MMESDRRLTCLKSKGGFVYEEEFIDKVYLGCFAHRVFVVIRQRSLYLYGSKMDYINNPNSPKLFFNMNYMNSTLTAEAVKISNGFTSATLIHEDSQKLVGLLEAINRGRTDVGAEDLFPKKFLYLSSGSY